MLLQVLGRTWIYIWDHLLEFRKHEPIWVQVFGKQFVNAVDGHGGHGGDANGLWNNSRQKRHSVSRWNWTHGICMMGIQTFGCSCVRGLMMGSHWFNIWARCDRCHGYTWKASNNSCCYRPTWTTINCVLFSFLLGRLWGSYGLIRSANYRTHESWVLWLWGLWNLNTLFWMSRCCEIYMFSCMTSALWGSWAWYFKRLYGNLDLRLNFGHIEIGYIQVYRWTLW